MLDKRQADIFKLITELYIKTARPVGSGAICETLDCSSATVRNVMASLEELGLLQKTHTSSGRIPSEKGYRYYVDYLMESEVNAEEERQLDLIFKNNSLALGDAINLSLEIIANLTNCTSVVLGTKAFDSHLKKVEVVVLNPKQAIGIFITDGGYVEHHQLELNNVSAEEIKQTVDLINKMLEGSLISDIISKLEYEIKPIISQYIKKHQELYQAFYNAFCDFSEKSMDVRYIAKDNLLNQPEFNDVDKIRQIIKKLDNASIIRNISSNENGINIYIGHENNFDEDVTVIKTSYEVGGIKKDIAFVGPKRMEYERVVGMLDYIKKLLENKGGDYFD